MKELECKCWNKTFTQHSPVTIHSHISYDDLNWLYKHWSIWEWWMWTKPTLWRCDECNTKYPNQEYLEKLLVNK